MLIRRGIINMLISILFFQLMNMCVKFIPHIPAHEIIFFRCVISLILSYIHLRILHIYPWGNRRSALILRGVFGMVSLTAFFITLQRMPLATAVTIQYLSPIFTITFAAFILNEKTRWIQYLFFIFSFAGIVIVKGFDERINNFDLALGIGSAICSGLAYTMIRKSRDSEHPLVVVFYFPLVAIPFVAVWSYFDWVTPLGSDWLFLMLTGFFTQAAQIYMTKAFQIEKASVISSIQYLGLIVSFGIGYFIFAETYTGISIMGMGMIVLGVLMNYLYDQVRQRL